MFFFNTKDSAKKYAEGGYVAVAEKDGYWTVISKPSSKEKAQQVIDMGRLLKGEIGKVVSVSEAKAHNKLIGAEYLADGGKVSWDMNWHSFTISQLKQWMNQHNYYDITVELTKEKEYHKYNHKKDDDVQLYFDKSLDLRSGEENMYFDIIVTDNNKKEWMVSFFTKENRIGLKKIAKSIVDIFAKGGKVLSSHEVIQNLEFEDNTDIKNGYYTFTFDTVDAEVAPMYDYSGSITLAPTNSRRDDEVEFDGDMPEDWEAAEEYIIDKFYEWKNRKLADGGEVSFDELAKEPKDKKVNVLDKSVNYDTRKALNRGSEKIPQELVNKIENRGITIEELDELTVPVFKYKTQITIHGIFDGDFNTRVGGYKSLMLNQNKSLGVRYTAIDAGKKKTIEDAIAYMKLNGEKPKWHVSKDSTGFSLYHIKPVTKETLEQVRDEMKQLFDNIPPNFIGDKYAYFQRTLWGGVQAVVMIHLNAIYEKDVFKMIDFVTDGYIKSDTDLKTAIDKYTQKRKAEQEEEQAKRKEKLDEERQKINELYIPQKTKLAESSPYASLTELPSKSYFDKHPKFRYAVITRNTLPDNTYLQQSGFDAVIEVREIEKRKQWFYENKYEVVNTWDDVNGKLTEQSRYGKQPTVDYDMLVRKIKSGVEKGLLYFNLQESKNPILKKDTATEVKSVKITPEKIVETQNKVAEPVLNNDIDLRLVNYSDKSVAVFGASTYQFRKSLASVGGTFNKFLTNPDTKQREAGWIYSIRNKAELEKIIENAKAGIIKFDEGGYVPRVPKVGEKIVFSTDGKKLFEAKVLGIGENQIGVDSGIKVEYRTIKGLTKAIIFRTDVVCILNNEKGIIATAKKDTADGEIEARVRWNAFWGKIQVNIDGVLSGEFYNVEDAIDDVERTGFENIEIK